ncbi:MAG: RDD family protein [Frankia sp.]
MTGPNFEVPKPVGDQAEQEHRRPAWTGPDRPANVVRSPVAGTLAGGQVGPGPVRGDCSACASPRAGGIVCPRCGQVAGLAVGVHVSSRIRRLGESVLGVVLFVLTLGIGYLGWSLIVWRDGTTPAKKLLHMTVISTETRQPASWECMAIREGVAKFLLCGVVIGSLLPAVGFAFCALPIFGTTRQTLWDRIATTLVVDDPAERPSL